MSRYITKCFACLVGRSIQSAYDSISAEEECDWKLAKLRGLGGRCCICGDERAVATVVSLPCHHSACRRCVSKWATPRCLICNVDCRVIGASFIHEPSRSDDPLSLMEASLDHAMTNIVSVKQALAETEQLMQTAIRHISAAKSEPEEVTTAVLQVEAAVISEQIHRLTKVLAEPLSVCEHSLCTAVKEVEHFAGDGGSVTTPTHTRCKMMLRPQQDTVGLARGPFGVQFRVMNDLIDSIVKIALPRALGLVGEHMSVEQAMSAVSLISVLEEGSNTGVSRVESAVERLESASAVLLDHLEHHRHHHKAVSFDDVSKMTAATYATYDEMLMEKRERIFEEEMAEMDLEMVL